MRIVCEDHHRRPRAGFGAGLLAAALLLAAAAPPSASAGSGTAAPGTAATAADFEAWDPGAPLILAGAPGTTGRELEPRYEPVPPQQQSNYNDAYIFALTRGVADSTLHPAAKAPLFLFTVPLDLVLLPVAAMGGLFG